MTGGSGDPASAITGLPTCFPRPRDTSDLFSGIKRGQQSSGPRRVSVDSSMVHCPSCLGHLSQSMSVDDNLLRPVEAVEDSTGYNHNHGAIRSRASRPRSNSVRLRLRAGGLHRPSLGQSYFWPNHCLQSNVSSIVTLTKPYHEAGQLSRTTLSRVHSCFREGYSCAAKNGQLWSICRSMKSEKSIETRSIFPTTGSPTRCKLLEVKRVGL